MSTSVAESLVCCYDEIMTMLDIEKVMDDMLTSVEVHSMESLLQSMEEQLELSQNLHGILKIESESLVAKSNWNIAEFERMRSEAISVRDILIIDVTNILLKNAQVEKYQKRIRELEGKETQMLPIMKNGASNLTSSAVSHDDESPIQLIYAEPPATALYVFADSLKGEAVKNTDSDPDFDDALISRLCPELIEGLEDKLLLLYVSFLDVSDVLIVSQLNRRLFAKLDQLFQNGSSIPKASWLINGSRSSPKPVVDDPSSAVNIAPAQVIEINKVEATLNDGGAVVAILPGDGAESSSSRKSSPAEGRYFGKFSMLLAAADNLLPNALTNGVMNAVGVNRVVPSSSAGSTNSVSNGKSVSSNKNGIERSVTFQTGVNGTAPSSSSSATGGLTREIAESLSKKLSGNHQEIPFVTSA